jgi:hypothetical protein
LATDPYTRHGHIFGAEPDKHGNDNSTYNTHPTQTAGDSSGSTFDDHDDTHNSTGDPGDGDGEVQEVFRPLHAVTACVF